MKKQDITPTNNLLTLDAAARILGVHPMTLKRWAGAGKLRIVRLPVGNRPRIEQSEIDRLIKAEQTPEA